MRGGGALLDMTGGCAGLPSPGTRSPPSSGSRGTPRALRPSLLMSQGQRRDLGRVYTQFNFYRFLK